jgi:lysophospholipase L1-like esterase
MCDVRWAFYRVAIYSAAVSLTSGVTRVTVLILVLAVEFALLEVGMRAVGGSEAAPAFQKIFMQDPLVGHRLQPNARTVYSTVEFSTPLAINPQGVRDDRSLGAKRPGQRRIVVLGDSLVLSVQVPLQEAFTSVLERDLAEAAPEIDWQVVNAGVQGYGPVDDWLFYRHVVDALDPDLVLIVAFVANDATEAFDKASWLVDDRPPVVGAGEAAVTATRRIVRASMVLQNLRLRWDQVKAAATDPGAERPLASYLAEPSVEVSQGLELTREAFGRIASRASARGAGTALVLMPARFQLDDADYGRLNSGVTAAGHVLLRHAATDRFRTALTPLGLPMLDLLPVLQAQDHPADLFFQRNIHLTPRGHAVVGHALRDFVLARFNASQAPAR